jgi:hypothetical protein
MYYPNTDHCVSTTTLDVRRRFGKFIVRDVELTDERIDLTFDFMRKFLVVEARYDLCWQGIVYLAMSPLFDICPDGTEAPYYTINVTEKDGQIIHVNAEKD